MPEDTCRVCGDRFGIWIGPPMSDGLCPLNGTREHCPTATVKAYGAAMRRKVCPDAFDESGKVKPDRLFEAMDAMYAAGLDPWTGLPQPVTNAAQEDSGDGQ